MTCRNYKRKDAWRYSRGAAVLLTALALSAVPALPVWAEELTAGSPAPFTLSLEELLTVTVTSSVKSEQAILDSPNAITVITADDIRRSGAAGLPEALALAPGVYVRQVGGNHWLVSVGGISLNDFAGQVLRDGSNRVLVLVDGVTVYSSLFGNVEWDQLPVSLAEVSRIEVIRGGGGLFYGANAVDGVISIFTREAGPGAAGGYVRAEGGNIGQRRLAAATGVGGETAAARLAVSYKRDKGTGGDGGALIDDGEDLHHAAVRTTFKVGPSTTLLVDGRFTGGESSEPGQGPFSLPTEWDNGTGIFRLQLEGHRPSGDSYIRYYHRHRSVDRDDGSGFVHYKHDYTDDLEFQRVFTGQGPGGHRLTVGGGLRSAELDHKVLLTGEEETAAGNLYVNDQWELSPGWTLHAGVKWERLDQAGSTVPWRAALLYRPDEASVMRASVSRNHRAPTLLELFQDTQAGPTTVVRGNPDLEPEGSSAAELQYRRALKGGGDLDVSWSRLRYKKVSTISLADPGPPSVISYFNDGAVTGDHLNLSLALPLSGRVTTRFSYSLLNTEFEGSEAGNTYSAPPDRLGTAAMYYDAFSGFAGLTAYYTGETSYADGYLRLDARVGRRLSGASGNMEVGLSGTNLLDDLHEEGGASIPRAYRLYLEMTL